MAHRVVTTRVFTRVTAQQTLKCNCSQMLLFPVEIIMISKNSAYRTAACTTYRHIHKTIRRSQEFYVPPELEIDSSIMEFRVLSRLTAEPHPYRPSYIEDP
jgi:hypothetical protein